MLLTVGEIAKVLGLSTENIRYYVREGLIHPQKNEENNYWGYSTEDALLISDILFYRDLGISINQIRAIFDGLPLGEIGSVIEETRAELQEKIASYREILQRLELWEDSYRWELERMGKYHIDYMPVALMVSRYYDNSEHIANYLKGSVQLERGEWMGVCLSFFCDTRERPLRFQRYITLENCPEDESQGRLAGAEEEAPHRCLCTCVLEEESLTEAINSLLAFAEEKDVALTGEVYGRERTNYYRNGERHWVYALYAPLADEGKPGEAVNGIAEIKEPRYVREKP